MEIYLYYLSNLGELQVWVYNTGKTVKRPEHIRPMKKYVESWFFRYTSRIESV